MWFQRKIKRLLKGKLYDTANMQMDEKQKQCNLRLKNVVLKEKLNGC